MDNYVSTFNFKGHSVRTLVIDGAPWFVAGDLCAPLGLPSGQGSGRWLRGFGVIEKRAVHRQTYPELSADTRAPEATIVSWAGLSKIAVHSGRPEIKLLRNWATRVVLPAIRKDDMPVAGEGPVIVGEPSEDEVISKAIEVMKRRIERLAAEQEKAQAIIDGLLSAQTHRTSSSKSTSDGVGLR